MWIIAVLSVSALIMLYLGWRVITPLSRRTGVRLFAWVIFGLILLGIFTVPLLHTSAIPRKMVEDVGWAIYVGFGFLSLFILLLIFKDVIILTRWCLKKAIPIKPTQRKIFFKEHSPERRRALMNILNGCVVAGATPITAYAVQEARAMPTVVRVQHPFANLPASLHGLTIAQLSDTHIGPTIKGKWLERCVNIVNALNPDIVVHTGDIVDGRAAWLKPDVAPLGELQAPLGKFFCTGNHEYYSGVHPWLEEMKRLDFTPLINDHHIITRGGARLLMAGVPDLHAHRLEPSHKSSPTQAKHNAPAHDISVLLAHRPGSVFEASKVEFNLQLSGHTHGGQFFPWTYVIQYFQPYVRGLHIVQNTRLYVNVGTGYWGPPLRLGAPPEITLHTLVSA